MQSREKIKDLEERVVKEQCGKYSWLYEYAKSKTRKKLKGMLKDDWHPHVTYTIGAPLIDVSFTNADGKKVPR
eukprot:3107068-Rhodomonas_salina.1